MRWVNRDTFRLARFLCTTPFCADRMMMGSATFKASAALVRSPDEIASSTFPTMVRSWVRRALLIAVLRAMTRVAFWAEGVFAILLSCPPDHDRRGQTPQNRSAISKKQWRRKRRHL